jgi:TolB-like protein/DNA-binding winged helix-turn-helix (wHTH) protein
MPNAVKRLYEFGPFQLDAAERLLRRGNERLDLPPRVFDTLVALAESDGRLLEKNELMDRIWPDATVEENNLSQAIYLLRKVLRDGENGSRYIETVPKRGYRFIAPVRLSEAPPSGPHAAVSGSDAPPLQREPIQRENAPPESAPPESAPPVPKAAIRPAVPDAHAAPEHHPAWRWVVPGVLTVAIAAVTAFLIARSLSSRQASAHPATHALAVLPLQNLSKDSGQDYFVDGFTEELVTDIAQIHSLRVISRTSTMAYKGTHKTLPQIARELHVDLVLEGSVIREGKRVRVTAQLINAPTDTHLWAQTYDSSVNDVLDIQSEISRAIASDVSLDLSPAERQRLATTRPVDPEAHDFYLRGRYVSALRNEQSLREAIGYYTQAAARDPAFALAYTGLSDCDTLLALFGDSGESWASEATANARKAIALDDTLAQAHTSLAAADVLNWNWSDAEKEFRRALDLNPNDAQTHHWYGNLFLGPMGRNAEAIAELQRALELNPLSLIITTDLGYAYFLSGQYDSAYAQYQKILAIDPNFLPVHYQLAAYYRERGMYDREVEEMTTNSRLAGRPAIASDIERLSSNRQELFETMAETAGNFNHPAEFSGSYATSVEAYLAAGHKDRALAALQKSYEKREAYMILLKVNPALASLRADPAFQDLERKVGLLSP